MNRTLPPLKSLQFFSVSARHMNFTLAADELHVTQAAVSQQIRNLESWFGFPLFRRASRQLQLTPEGQELLPYVDQAFSTLQAGINDLTREQSRPINVSVLPSFAYRWLVPRLSRFTDLHPKIDIRLALTTQLADLANSDIDLGIRFGRGHYPGLDSQFLMGDVAFPVCSPKLLAAAPLKKPEDLKHHRILCDHGPDDLNWKQWLSTAGIPDLALRFGTIINDSSLVLNAAREGHGVALARASLVEDDMASGELVKPFSIDVPSDFSYFLVTRKTYSSDTKLSAFCDWLRSEVQS